MINYYYDNTNELKPYTHQLDANADTLPPDNALRTPPPEKHGFWPCFKNGAWVLIENHRGKTSYNIETTESVEIDYVGPVRDGFTLLEPFEFCVWDKKTKSWVLDEDQKNAAIIQKNESIKNSFLAAANEKIAVLQDIIDLDMCESNESEQLKQWKKYRILVIRVDTNQLDIEWPKQPE
ncbi:hypothetical protein A9G08_04555 [Gilliamella sp. wkB195]|uniref:tail fiber assembly protein n=1 Tax=Gilliamella sp. wkB195 TaxID=3120261 RepID=UPI00080E7F04|nr:tail fiber assembly protein [Gilliamella apicola]OCF95526.1 hypothetical protein A9G08_11465 [Gilliamella apicola]OCG00180.1 hypothetical protein A9G08_04555 [Gilliamella apicola]